MTDLATLAICVDSSGVTTASKDLDKLTGAAKQTETSTKRATDSIKASWLSIAAVTAATVALIKQSTQAFMEQEKATLKMGMAMKNQGDYSRAALADMQNYAAELQKVTAYEDDATVSMMANLKSYGMTNEEVKKSMKIAMDFAAAKQAEGMTVSTAAELLGKAYAGNTMMLGRYGIIIDDSIKKGEKFDAVLKLLNQRFGGSAQAELLTYAGQWAKLKNQWSDIQEFLGLVFLKTLQALQVAAGLVAVAFMSMGSKILQVLDFLMTPIKGILQLLGLIADAVGATGISTAMDLAANSISEARKNILATEESVMGWTNANYESLKSFEGVEGALDKMGKSGQRTTYNIKDQLTEAEQAALKLREEWEKTADKLNQDIQLSGLTGLSKELLQNQLEAEQLKKQFKDLPKGIKEVAYALIEKTQATKDATARSAEMAQAEQDYLALLEEEKKLLNDKIGFYSTIEGYEQQAFDLKMMRIKNEREEYIKLYGDLGAANAKYNQDATKAFSEKIDAEQKGTKDIISNYSKIIDAAMTCYSDESNEYKRLQDFKKVALAAELAMEVAKNAQIIQGYFTRSTAAVASAAVQNTANASTAVTGAVSSVAAQGTVPVAGFGMVAAMLALMTGILGTAGIAFGGGSTSASMPTLPKSTVLGAADGTGSQSIENSYKLLQDTYELENTKLTEIRNELQNLNQNITGLVTSIVKTGGISPKGMGINISGDTVYGDFLQRVERWGGGFGHLVGAEGGFIGQLEDFLSKPLMQIASWIGGGEQSRSVSQSGISFSGSLSGGMNAQQYADIVSKINGGAFSSDKSITNTKYLPLNNEVSNYIEGIFNNIKTTIRYVADGLGVDANDAFNHTFNELKLNLQGKTQEEMIEAVNVFFSNFSDEISTILSKDIPLEDYQRLGEGLLETSVRLVVQMSTVTSWFDSMSVSLNKTTPELIEFTDAVISQFDDIQAAKEAWSYFYKEFIPADQQLSNSIRTTTESLSALGYQMPKTEAAFVDMISGAMKNPELLAGLLKLSPSIHSIIESWTTATESAADEAKAAAEAAKQVAQDALNTAKGDLQKAFEAAKATVTSNYNTQLTSMNKVLSDLTENVNKLKSARERMNLVDAATTAIVFQRSKQALMKGYYNDDILASVSSISPEQYSTKAAYMSDYGKIYGQLALLQSQAESKVSYQQRHIDLLTKTYEAQMAAYDKQYNELLNIDTSVLSVADAIKKFQTASAAVGNCSVPAYANGGYVMVGEQGPELARFGSSARVYSNKDSKSLLDTTELKLTLKEILSEIKKGNSDFKPKIENIDRNLDRWEKIGPHAVRT